MKHRVYVELPRSGLGNLLLIWSRAKVFSHVKGIPLVTSSWWNMRWGSWLRLENKKRMYWGYFKESPIWQRFHLRFFRSGFAIQREPKITKESLPVQPTLFVFSTTVVEDDLFASIRLYRDLIKQELQQLVRPALLIKLDSCPAPLAAVHIRRGDFKISNPITPISFFIAGIRYIREQTAKCLPVTVFTDADEKEICDILAMENVFLAKKNPDILDILLMSRSRILILSQSSTFSYWAAFLSNAILIKPKDDWQGDLRPIDVNKRCFEGKVDFNDPATLTGLSIALQKEKW